MKQWTLGAQINLGRIIAVSFAIAGLFVALGCGGVVKFEDRSSIAVKGTPPPPPPPPAAEKPAPARVELRDDRIAINEKIQFAYNDARILEASYGLLDEIASVMKKNPQVKRIEIGGHASSEGSDAYNLRLSDRRAKAVMTYLTDKAGIAKDRLTAKGYGETKLLVTPDDTESQRETNRRVEFLILEQEVTKRRVELDPKTGQEKVLETIPETSK